MVRRIDRSRHLNLALSALIALGLASSFAVSAAAQRYTQTNLVSNIPGLAAFTDPNLVNPWGIALSPTSPFWISDNNAWRLTLYNTAGQPQPLVVGVPGPDGAAGSGTPTGQVFNGTSDFQIAPGKPGIFIACTEDGSIAAWNPGVDLVHAVLVVNRSQSGAVYKGLALANNGSANFLYVANFHSGKIDVFDKAFSRVVLPSRAFRDSRIPRRFAPFNVQNIGGKLYVTYALRDGAATDSDSNESRDDENDIDDALGFVDVFTPSGKLIQRLESGWWLNAPWGVTLTPPNFGRFSNALLVGNFGNGWIAAYNPKTGEFLGLMQDSSGRAITIDGLWALKFGNGAAGGAADKLYFTAGLHSEQDGLFGSLSPAP